MGKCGRRWRQKNRLKLQKSNNSRVIACDMDPNLINLCRWMKSENVGKSSKNSSKNTDCSTNLKPSIFPLTGRGMKATKAIHKDDVIVSIPRNLLINWSDVMSDTVLANMLITSAQEFSSIELLAAFILYHKSLGKDSRWWPYINSLPDKFHAIQNDEVNLYPSFIQSKLSNFQTLLYTALCKLKKVFSAPLSNGVSFTDEEILWAYLAVNTRTVYLENRGTCKILQEGDDGACALATFLDLLNHSLDARMTAFLDDDNCYKIVTSVPYKRNSQVFISYGGHDNLTLYVDYGFILPNNPFDGYPITDLKCLESVVQKYTKGLYDIASRIEELSKFPESRNMYLLRDGPSWSVEAIINVFMVPSSSYQSALSHIYQDVDRTVEFNAIVTDIIDIAYSDTKNGLDRMLSKENPSDYLKTGCDFVMEILTVLKDCKNNFTSQKNL